MKKTVFTGIATALVTPLTPDGIDYNAFARLLDWQCDEGIDALVVCGTTGESSTLTDDEHRQAIDFAVKHVNGRVPVIAGTGSNDTDYALDLTRHACESGADGVLVVTPYYNKATPDGLYAHYLAIARSVNIPVILYNVPSRTGVDIPVSVYARLAAIENIVGVKEASSDITKVGKIRAACGDRMHIWSGNDDMIVPVMSLGGKGVISVLSNVLPEETVAMCRAALEGDYKKASALQCGLMELVGLLFCEVNPIPVKTAMKEIGFDCGGCRMPLSPMSTENYKKLKTYLQEIMPL